MSFFLSVGTSGYQLVPVGTRSTKKTKTKSAVLPTSLMSFFILLYKGLILQNWTFKSCKISIAQLFNETYFDANGNINNGVVGSSTIDIKARAFEIKFIFHLGTKYIQLIQLRSVRAKQDLCICVFSHELSSLFLHTDHKQLCQVCGCCLT